MEIKRKTEDEEGIVERGERNMERQARKCNEIRRGTESEEGRER